MRAVGLALSLLLPRDDLELLPWVDTTSQAVPRQLSCKGSRQRQLLGRNKA